MLLSGDDLKKLNEFLKLSGDVKIEPPTKIVRLMLCGLVIRRDIKKPIINENNSEQETEKNQLPKISKKRKNHQIKKM